VRVTSSDPLANTPKTATMSNGFAQLSIALGTVGSQTLTATDQTNGSITPNTSAPIAVIPERGRPFRDRGCALARDRGRAADDHDPAADANGNTIPNYGGDARLAANTGAGSMSPEAIAFSNGIWTGPVSFFGAGGASRSRARTTLRRRTPVTSNAFTVQPGPLAGLQVLLPGETAQGGTADGKTGTPTAVSAGQTFTLTLRAVDAYWNLVPGVSDRVALGSSDAFAAIPAETTLANGQRLLQARLFRSGAQRIWASDVDNPGARADTSSAVVVGGGPFARVLVLAPGESPAPGTSPDAPVRRPTSRSTSRSAVTVLATDQWWNPVTGVSDVVRIGSDDPMAVLPADQADGRRPRRAVAAPARAAATTRSRSPT
jgi:hypothetical protein